MAGFRLHPGPLPEQYRMSMQVPTKKKLKKKKNKVSRDITNRCFESYNQALIWVCVWDWLKLKPDYISRNIVNEEMRLQHMKKLVVEVEEEWEVEVQVMIMTKKKDEKRNIKSMIKNGQKRKGNKRKRKRKSEIKKTKTNN